MPLVVVAGVVHPVHQEVVVHLEVVVVAVRLVLAVVVVLVVARHPVLVGTVSWVHRQVFSF